MSAVVRGRHVAGIDGDFVVFLIGMRAGEYEAIYSGVPRFGLGAAGRLVAAHARSR